MTMKNYRYYKQITFTALLTAAVLLFTGCSAPFLPPGAGEAADGSGDRGFLSAPVVNNAIYSNDYIIDEGPVKGGEVRVYATHPDTFNPLLTRNMYMNAMFGLVYEGLAGIGPEHTAVPRLAERWAPLYDGLAWSVKLREGLIWHDGRPLRASDVINTIDKIREYGPQCPYYEMIANIASATAASDTEIRLSLINENAYTPYTLLFPIVPSHIMTDALDGLSGGANLRTALVGSGPYRFASYETGKSITLGIAPSWIGVGVSANSAVSVNANSVVGASANSVVGVNGGSDTEKGAGISPPYIESVVFLFHDPVDTALSKFRSRDLDLFFSKTINYTRYQHSSELRIRQYSDREFVCVAMNYSKGITAAKSVRRAMLRLTDRGRLIGNAMDGRGIAAEYPIQPEGRFFGPGVPGTPYDPQAARSILESAGFRYDDGLFYGDTGGGWRSLSVNMLVNAHDSEKRALADAMVRMYKDGGVEMNIQYDTEENIIKKISAGDYEMALLSYRTRHYPDLTELYSTSWMDGKNTLNPAKFQNDEVDRLSHELFTVYDEQDRQAAFLELIAIIQDESPYIGLFFRASALVHGEDIRGGVYPYDRNPLNNFENWYISDYR